MMPTFNASGTCLAKIHAQLQGQSNATVKIARYILKNPSRALNMTIRQLANACDNSMATITKFCLGLGYAGYKEFQLDLAAALAKEGAVALDHFVPGASPESIIRQVFECNRRSLVDTERLLDHEVLIRVARIIGKAPRIYFIGMGGSASLACTASERFLSLGHTAIAVTDPYEQIFAMNSIKRGDVVIGVSHTGRTSLIVEAIRTARQRGANTVVITNYPHSPLAQASEHCLLTAFREHRINAAVSSSRIAQMSIVDSLYFVVASRSGRSAQSLADEVEENVQRVLRSKLSMKSSQ